MSARNPKPTPRQLRYLRALAERSGTTFTPPKTLAQASQAIEELKGRRRSGRLERRLERREVKDALAGGLPASSVGEDEIAGYGSSAHWAKRR